MDEWITQIFTAASGLPWWAMFVVILATIACTKGIDALLKFRKSRLEERQYEDGQTKSGYDALVAELKSRVEKLEGLVEKQADKLEAATTAHANCEIEQEKLRGELNVMKEKVARLEAHDQANKDNTVALKSIVKKIDPEAAAELP